jgi:hypothetical protein
VTVGDAARNRVALLLLRFECDNALTDLDLDLDEAPTRRRLAVQKAHHPLQTAVRGDTLRSRRHVQGATVAFVQIIEIETTKPDEVEALVGEWRAKTEGARKAQRGTFTKDRDRPDTYVQIVEFPSYEDAMANSELPETASFAEKLRSLCDAPLVFRNLDVRSVEEL